jgi:Holliday junction resolvase RusA-like endonuclease
MTAKQAVKVKKLVYEVFAEGEPKAQPRPRRGKHGNFYNPGTADGWKRAVQAAFLRERKPAIEGPVYLTVNFFFHREGIPGRAAFHTAKPDRDNLEKAVMDALTEIGVWKDDCQVCAGLTAKYWTSGKSGAEIRVETIEAPR